MKIKNIYNSRILFDINNDFFIKGNLFYNLLNSCSEHLIDGLVENYEVFIYSDDIVFSPNNELIDLNFLIENQY